MVKVILNFNNMGKAIALIAAIGMAAVGIYFAYLIIRICLILLG